MTNPNIININPTKEIINNTPDLETINLYYKLQPNHPQPPTQPQPPIPNYTLLHTILTETYKESLKPYNPTGSVITPYLTTDYKTHTATSLSPSIYQPPRTIDGTTYLTHTIKPAEYLDEETIQKILHTATQRSLNKKKQYIIITDYHNYGKTITTKPLNQLHDPLSDYTNNTQSDSPYSVQNQYDKKKKERLHEAKQQLIESKGLYNKPLDEIYLPKYQLSKIEESALQEVYNYQITKSTYNKVFIVRININEHLQGSSDKFKVKLYNKHLQTPLYIKKLLQQPNITIYIQDIQTKEYISHKTLSHIIPTWDYYNTMYNTLIQDLYLKTYTLKDNYYTNPTTKETIRIPAQPTEQSLLKFKAQIEDYNPEDIPYTTLETPHYTHTSNTNLTTTTITYTTTYTGLNIKTFNYLKHNNLITPLEARISDIQSTLPKLLDNIKTLRETKHRGLALKLFTTYETLLSELDQLQETLDRIPKEPSQPITITKGTTTQQTKTINFQTQFQSYTQHTKEQQEQLKKFEQQRKAK